MSNLQVTTDNLILAIDDGIIVRQVMSIDNLSLDSLIAAIVNITVHAICFKFQRQLIGMGYHRLVSWRHGHNEHLTRRTPHGPFALYLFSI